METETVQQPVITLYTTGCPQCKVLEKKLYASNFSFNIIPGAEDIRALGFLSAPILKVDDKCMTFKEACDFLDGEMINNVD